MQFFYSHGTLIFHGRRHAEGGTKKLYYRRYVIDDQE